MAKKDIQNIISQITQNSEEEEKKQVDTTQLLVFDLDQEEYAVNIMDTREIISIPDITPIPNAPKFIRGILNLRGKIVVVVDLEKRFNLTRENKVNQKHIIITEVMNNDYGIVVDQVKEVIRVPVESIRPTPELVSAKIHADYLNGVVVIDEEMEKTKKEKVSKEENKKKNKKQESRLLVLLDLPKLLQEKELLQLGEAVKKNTQEQ